MADGGISFGAHTMSHAILSRLEREAQRKEIVDSKRLIEEKAGVEVKTFAYPWGRAWDFNDDTKAVLKEEGFTSGLAMDEASALPGRCDLYDLSRYPLAEGFRLDEIIAEATGLLRGLEK